MTKPIFGSLLGQKINESELPEPLTAFFGKLL
jgi:hypothetical protein